MYSSGLDETVRTLAEVGAQVALSNYNRSSFFAISIYVTKTLKLSQRRRRPNPLEFSSV
jgi:hypothetical protein